jgi:hypothetical protein
MKVIIYFQQLLSVHKKPSTVQPPHDEWYPFGLIYPNTNHSKNSIASQIHVSPMRMPASVNAASLCVSAQSLCVKIALTLTDASTDGILNQRVKLL